MVKDDGRVLYASDGVTAHITFDRPAARNAMTWQMYEELVRACDAVMREPMLKLVVFRGAGRKAFVAGTDISQFREFESSQDGVDYEQRVEECIGAIEDLVVPTLAVIEGGAFGGGLIIAASCDLRIATPNARFGVPIARTLGNCLSIANCARLGDAFGTSRASRMLMLAESLTAEEALSAGFVSVISPPDELDVRVRQICDQVIANAPITIKAIKQAQRRLKRAVMPDDEDLVRACYGSNDFRVGIEAFLGKKPPQWTGT